MGSMLPYIAYMDPMGVIVNKFPEIHSADGIPSWMPPATDIATAIAALGLVGEAWCSWSRNFWIHGIYPLNGFNGDSFSMGI